jgi:hypothetical protein
MTGAALQYKLGYFEPFALHDRLLKIRSSHGANTPGEAKLARAWLEELFLRNSEA